MNKRVTTFKNRTSPPGEMLTLQTIANDIKTGKYREQIEEIRAAVKANPDDSNISQLKGKLAAFTPSGIFAGKRSKETVTQYTQVVCLDIDKIAADKIEAARAKIQAEARTQMCFLSPSGNGLKVLINVNSEEKDHEKVYGELKHYYYKLTGLVIDKSGKDVSRLCFVSYDPDLFIGLGEVYVWGSNPVSLAEANAEEAYAKAVASGKVNAPAELPIQQESAPTNTPKTKPATYKSFPNPFMYYENLTNNKRTFIKGERSNYTFLFACNCNRGGLSHAEVESYCLQNFVQSDFTADEVRMTVDSAYAPSRSHDHNKYPYKQKWGTTPTQKQFDAAEASFCDKEPQDDFTDEQVIQNATLLNILANINPEGFKATPNIPEKFKWHEHKVLSAEYFKKTIFKNKYHICAHREHVYLFNKEYWEKLYKEDIEALLLRASIKIKITPITIKDERYQGDLYKQFVSLAKPFPREIIKGDTKINFKSNTGVIAPDGVEINPFAFTDFLTYKLPFDYDANATAPVFDKFIKEILPDEESRGLLQDFLGCTFLGRSKKHKKEKVEKMMLLYGGGENGKSVLCDVITALLGDSISHCSLEDLVGKNSYSLPSIEGKLLNFGSELGNSETTNIDTLKRMISCEKLVAREIYGRPFVMKNFPRFVFNCNATPTKVDPSRSYYRRFIIIPFNVTIEKPDPELTDKIIDNELPGVFNWVLEGVRRYAKYGFGACKAADEAMRIFKISTDNVAAFLDELGYEATEHRQGKLFDKLLEEYNDYEKEHGRPEMRPVMFSKRLTALGFKIVGYKDIAGAVADRRKYVKLEILDF